MCVLIGKSFFMNPSLPPDTAINDLVLDPPTPEPEIILSEASEMSKSESQFWWLNSGAKVSFQENIIKTIQGDLDINDSWRVKYHNSNPTETDNGYHPQNIFRLVTREQYAEPTQEMYFKINRYILSEDPHRAASNGVLFFHRYKDGDNLYYAGLRVDGNAVIKKKIKGEYFTMIYQPIYSESKYNRTLNPNLITLDKWIGIKTEIYNESPVKVVIKLYVDLDSTGTWTLAAQTSDESGLFGGNVINGDGYAGIRSDFMDVEFKDYKIRK